MNPFETKCKSVNEYIMDWRQMSPKPYDKNKASPYTKVRQILMNGTEFEANWFLHQFARHTADNDIRRAIAVVRQQEQQQQKRLAALKPLDETILETTIGYEQLAVDLTAILAQRETDQNNVKALNFALLEDFDHLYRFANMLKMDYGVDAERLVGGYTEITPGRPTIAEHRYGADNVRYSMDGKKAQLFSILVGNIITAAEQQTMNFYMNVGGFYPHEHGRKMYAEIAMIEEEHVSQYESLKDPNMSWLMCWVAHEYTECYLYASMMEDETDARIRRIYAEHYEMEVAHLKMAADLLARYEKKDFLDVLPAADFPELLRFGGNKQYIRDVLANTVWLTGDKEAYVSVQDLHGNNNFELYQSKVNSAENPSHAVTNMAIKSLGEDYRYEDSPNPVKELQSRRKDNVTVGRPTR
jgi:hypothetical protein